MFFVCTLSQLYLHYYTVDSIERFVTALFKLCMGSLIVLSILYLLYKHNKFTQYLPEIASLICFVFLNEAGITASLCHDTVTFDGFFIIATVLITISNSTYNLKRQLFVYVLIFAYVLSRYYFILEDVYRYFRFTSYAFTSLTFIYIVSRFNV